MNINILEYDLFPVIDHYLSRLIEWSASVRYHSRAWPSPDISTAVAMQTLQHKTALNLKKTKGRSLSTNDSHFQCVNI